MKTILSYQESTIIQFIATNSHSILIIHKKSSLYFISLHYSLFHFNPQRYSSNPTYFSYSLSKILDLSPSQHIHHLLSVSLLISPIKSICISISIFNRISLIPMEISPNRKILGIRAIMDHIHE